MTRYGLEKCGLQYISHYNFVTLNKRIGEKPENSKGGNSRLQRVNRTRHLVHISIQAPRVQKPR